MATAQSSPARLEAFSDGVIAVIVTIMVLELKVPTPPGWRGLQEVLPTLLVYALSFTFTGIYWINHRELINRLPHIDNIILHANLVFLFCLSLLPFFTRYVLDKHMDSFSVALYGVSNIVIGGSFMLLRLAVMRRLRHAKVLARHDTAAQTKHWLSLLVYLVAIPLAFLHPRISLALIAFVTCLWAVPDIGVPHYGDHEKEGHIQRT
jgi:uncharacterized membrane protein